MESYRRKTRFWFRENIWRRYGQVIFAALAGFAIALVICRNLR